MGVEPEEGKNVERKAGLENVTIPIRYIQQLALILDGEDKTILHYLTNCEHRSHLDFEKVESKVIETQAPN